MVSILELFVESCGNLETAVKILNLMTGGKLRTSRYREWLNGSRTPSREYLDKILPVAISYGLTNGRLEGVNVTL